MAEADGQTKKRAPRPSKKKQPTADSNSDAKPKAAKKAAAAAAPPPTTTTGRGKKQESGVKKQEGGVKKQEGGVKKQEGGGKKPSAVTKSYKLSQELAEVVGSDKMTRREVIKKLWSIIKERELKDPKNKHYTICDDQLFKVFGVKRFRTFGMMKHLKDQFRDAA